jgi:hypothetical protein
MAEHGRVTLRRLHPLAWGVDTNEQAAAGNRPLTIARAVSAESCQGDAIRSAGWWRRLSGIARSRLSGSSGLR